MFFGISYKYSGSFSATQTCVPSVSLTSPCCLYDISGISFQRQYNSTGGRRQLATKLATSLKVCFVQSIVYVGLCKV